MERPTTKQVAFELDFATQPIETGSQGEWHLCAHRLAREVLALQEDLRLARLGEQDAIDRCGNFTATIARAEALLLKWRGKKPRGTGTMTTGEVAVVQYAFQDAAEDLEAALKGAT